MRRPLSVLAIVVAFMTTGNAKGVTIAEEPRAALFVTLPMTNGFADATDDLVDTQWIVHDALVAAETVRLVDRLEDSDVVLTVIGRGTGYGELTAALQEVNRDVVITPVLLHSRERFIEAMLTIGSCGDAATNAINEGKSAGCYRKIFIGLGDHNLPPGVPKAAHNSWAVCANALARDVQAWIAQNAPRLFAARR